MQIFWNNFGKYLKVGIIEDDKNRKEIAEYLRAQGFPAFDPVGRDGSIEILVGATPTRGELSAILSRLRVTKGPNGRSYDFETAYIDNIDNHTDR